MNPALLKCTPKQILCPYCGEWHNWNGRELEYYNTSDYTITLTDCDTPRGCRDGRYNAFFYNDNCYYSFKSMCRRANLSISGNIPISSLVESEDEPIVTFRVAATTDNDVGSCECSPCSYKNSCNLVKLGDATDNRRIVITFGFKFDQEDYDKFTKAAILSRKLKEIQEYESDLQRREQSLREQESYLIIKDQSLQEREAILADKEKQTQIKEELTMSETTKNGTTIKTLLYENSPKENLELMRTWAEKYKPVLKWAVPVAAVYAAYRILNSNECDLSVNNVAETCEKKLGFKIAFLENQKALKELMVLGGISAGAYGAVQAISGFLGNNKREKEVSTDVSVEELEAGMTQLESISKKFSFLQPTTENMLPIALSVILVYTTLHKPRFTGKFAKKVHLLTEDFQIKVGLYRDLAKSFIQDKFNIDLSNDAEQKKIKICVFLLGIMGVLAFLYGKKVLGNKANSEAADETDNANFNKSVTVFVEQAKGIVEKLAPTLYTSLITLLVSKKLLSLEEEPVVLEETDIEKIMEQEDTADAKNAPEDESDEDSEN